MNLYLFPYSSLQQAKVIIASHPLILDVLAKLVDLINILMHESYAPDATYIFTVVSFIVRLKD